MNLSLRTRSQRTPWLLACLCVGITLGCARSGGPARAPQPAASGAADSELNVLREEVARLKRLVPSQSHAMQDVGYHFTNLWFASQKGNWPLAAFYLAETRSHLKWAVRIIPVRKVRAGDVELEGIREAFDSSLLASLQQAIEARDGTRFTRAYKAALEGCYACHKASEKPFLRPQVPTRPEVQIINFDPTATWPE